MSAPKRIQRKRVKGWRMPENTRYVGRPSGWGNPFVPGEPYRFADGRGATYIGIAPADRTQLVQLFRTYVHARPDLWARIQSDLGDRDLACWCPLDQPCHADVLLDLANRGGT